MSTKKLSITRHVVNMSLQMNLLKLIFKWKQNKLLSEINSIKYF